MNATNETNWIEEIGKPAFESIADMVAALNCDYDRLEELRDEREDFNRRPGRADCRRTQPRRTVRTVARGSGLVQALGAIPRRRRGDVAGLLPVFLLRGIAERAGFARLNALATSANGRKSE